MKVRVRLHRWCANAYHPEIKRVRWTMREDFEFFLGGRDLEMEAVRRLLEEHAPGRVHDRGLRWSDARASVYRDAIADAHRRERTPVLIELRDDIDAASRGAVLIDHHGAEAGASARTAVEQVFDLLGLPLTDWTRWLSLVAANDRGHIDAMLDLGATPSEIKDIRDADRAAQGISAEEDAVAQDAIGRASAFGSRALFVELPHAHTAAVMDRLHPALGGQPWETVVVVSPSETNVYGPGWLVRALDRRIQGGWLGGDLPRRGFWGCQESLPEIKRDVVQLLQEHSTTPA